MSDSQVPRQDKPAAALPSPSEAHRADPGEQTGKASATGIERAGMKDIGPLLSGWDYEAGTINVRKISGSDGQPKLQMRLDLGLLQMEMTGRPDGARPHGCESLLEYFEGQLEQHRSRHGTDDGFALTTQQCRVLREEAVMYYHRYLSLFVLEDFSGVIRDTARNLRVIDLCGQHAADERDRLLLEQYRPYITMMNARAKACILMKEQKFEQALRTIKVAMGSIKRFFKRFNQDEAYERSNEILVLRRLARDIRRKMPIDHVKQLQRRLERAVKAERYEVAAQIRDEIRRRSEETAGDAAPARQDGAQASNA